MECAALGILVGAGILKCVSIDPSHGSATETIEGLYQTGHCTKDPRTVHSWFELTKGRLLNDPELAECWKDPRRI